MGFYLNKMELSILKQAVKSFVTKRNENDGLLKFYYCVVRNIPPQLHSSHLRSFFSDFVDKKLFQCFHYKHRPEELKQKDKEESKQSSTCCVIVSFRTKSHRNTFIQKYNGKFWSSLETKLFNQKCLIQNINIENKYGTSSKVFLTRKEKKMQKNLRSNENVTIEHLSKLSELRPPQKVLPNGNVGTPRCVLMELIRNCKFPP